MIQPRFDAEIVLFDLDGTLVDTLPDLTYAIDTMLHALDCPPSGADNVRIWVGNGMDKLLERALRHARRQSPDLEIMAQARELFNEIYGRCYADNSCLYPEAAETLAELRRMSLELGVVTNKPIGFTEALLDKLAIRHYFGVVLGGDSLPLKKPDPSPLFHAARILSPGASRCIFVGDSVNDIQAARNAGWPVICLPYGYNHGQDIRDGHPDAIIHSLAELPPLLRPLAGSTREPADV